MDPTAQDAPVHMFGLVLRQLRSQADLSLRELGKRSLYDYTRISRAERGEFLPPIETVKRIDQVLGARRLLIELRGAAERTSPVAASCLPGSVIDNDPVILELRMPIGGSLTVRMSRRHFTQLLASGALALALPGVVDTEGADRLAGALDSPSRLDDEVLTYFRRVLSEHYQADQMLGPHRLLRPVLTQVEVLEGLRKSARSTHVGPLLQILSQYAEMTGWLYQDLGHLNAAMDWSRRAAEWARCAGDTDMATYMLIRQSNIACLGDDRAAVVQYAAAARMTSGVDPKITALASQQEARGHALLGEHSTCRTLLDSASRLLDEHPQVSNPSVPVYLHHYDAEALEEQSAVCYRLAGDGDTAAAILEGKLARTPDPLAREKGLLTAKLALAITQTRREPADPSRAADLGMTALDLAQHTGSARIRRELDQLDTELTAGWPDLPETRNFQTALAA